MSTEKWKLNADRASKPAVPKQEPPRSAETFNPPPDQNFSELRPYYQQHFYPQQYYQVDNHIYPPGVPRSPHQMIPYNSQIPANPATGNRDINAPERQPYMVPSQFPPNFRPPGQEPYEIPSQTPPSTTSNDSQLKEAGSYATLLGDEPSKKKQKKNSSLRRRALTACNTCRTKKVKCDNARPRCGSCVKNGVELCQYSNEDQLKDIVSDPASLVILMKLDQIMDNLNEIKGSPNSNPKPKNKPSRQVASAKNGIWDLSFISILKWRYLGEKIPDLQEMVPEMERDLLKKYTLTSTTPLELNIKGTISNLTFIERTMIYSLPQSVNSFFVNCHTKVPVLDVLDFLESIELFKIFQESIPDFSIIDLASDFHKIRAGAPIHQKYLDGIEKSLIPDPEARKRAFDSLCEKLALIPVVSALGVLSSPIQLDNFAKYASSIEERNDVSASCLTEKSLEQTEGVLRKERLSIALGFIKLANLMVGFYPDIFKEYSYYSVMYNIFLNQFYLYIMSPIAAFRHINLACQEIMYSIEEMRDGNEIVYPDEKRKGIMERLFWTCLKLECELRHELSPHVPTSGIIDYDFPCSFPSIPDPIVNQAEDPVHSHECLKIASRFDDHYTWYYFLTEIAVRKVDNEIFNEFYSVESMQNGLWDQERFYNETFWTSFIRYNNQYNGIINSLSPRIRSFVLKEVDITQIFKSIASVQMKRQSDSSTITENLDDYLIDDNLIIQAQSELIMYIKTRILTSKLLLARPLIHLILEDKIPLETLLRAALELFAEEGLPLDLGSDLVHTSSSESNPFNHVSLEFDKILEAPLYYQNNNRHEDFSNFFSSADGKLQEESEFKMHMLGEAKTRTIKLFLMNLKSFPKLNIPKLGAHRHPGQWYYIRNLLCGVFYLYMLYEKFHEVVDLILSEDGCRPMIENNPLLQSEDSRKKLLEALLSKEIVIASLNHAMVVFNYWKDEAQDCEVYLKCVKLCLAKLQ